MDGNLVSGSWDHTICIWRNWKKSSQLKKHDGPIWDVKIASVDASSIRIISASADKTLILWNNDQVYNFILA